MTDTYNGWKNRATWNVALWINNDAVIYEQARGFLVDYEGKKPYQDFVDAYGYISTPDGELYENPSLDIKALDEMMKEL
jgi:hypothetical protein